MNPIVKALRSIKSLQRKLDVLPFDEKTKKYRTKGFSFEEISDLKASLELLAENNEQSRLVKGFLQDMRPLSALPDIDFASMAHIRHRIESVRSWLGKVEAVG